MGLVFFGLCKGANPGCIDGLMILVFSSGMNVA